MIRLAGSSNLVWTSPTFLHTVKSGTSFSQYVLNHNLGKIPDLIKYYSVAADSAPNVERQDFYSDGTNFGGSGGVDNDVNTSVVNIYRVRSTNITIYFKVFVLDGDGEHL